ncbi:hypothetical protein NPIL_254771 [Nephila pilipes]|uniref:Uncharacterized protein n=1 Tax=Nephila pilipes TaxID=299642 RepID=A0A8X6MU02_NEPPI|nr:hypothetical protein NPIL_254771 [Nephila pilipes]
MNRKMWKCCGNTFSDYAKYNKHVLIFHNKNADYEKTNASNRNGRTTLDESQDGCSKQIRVTKSTTGMNEYKKDISVVDSNDSDRIIETPTKKECKENIALGEIYDQRSAFDSKHEEGLHLDPGFKPPELTLGGSIAANFPSSMEYFRGHATIMVHHSREIIGLSEMVLDVARLLNSAAHDPTS